MALLKRKKATKEEVVEKATKSAKTSAVKAAPKKTTASKKKKRTSVSPALMIIKRPIVSEKTAQLAELGKYVFEISRDAGRVEVKEAIALLYGVKPVSVNVQRYAGKRVRFGKFSGKRRNWKKAIVTLPKGKKIDVYEGV